MLNDWTKALETRSPQILRSMYLAVRELSAPRERAAPGCPRGREGEQASSTLKWLALRGHCSRDWGEYVNVIVTGR